MKILFLHGWHSVPGGVEPTCLKKHGHTVINPALDDDDFDAAVRTAQAEYDQHQPDVIVGSSRGWTLMNDHQRISPATKLPPRRKKLATSAMRVGRKSSFRWTSPKAQVRRMWRTVQSAAEQIQSTFKLMTTVMPKSGLNPNRTTIDPIQETAHQRIAIYASGD